MRMQQVTARLDWARIGAQLDEEGHAIVAGLLSDGQVSALATLCRESSMRPVDVGSGDGSHEPRLQLVEELCAALYEHVVPIADRWAARLGGVHRHTDDSAAPVTHAQLSCSRLREGDHQPLQRHADGDRAFPLQLAVLLSEPGRDFTGGEFVMTEQRPRMQSRPMVLPLRRGDVAIFAAAQRPHRGSKRDYRVQLKHAISRVHSGERVGLDLLLRAAVRADAS